MSREDWAKKYGEMDKRVFQKYEQMPSGEQVGKRPEAANQPSKNSEVICP